MQAKQVCTIAALAMICACALEEDDFEAVGSSVHEVRGPQEILEKIADAEPGSKVEFPGARPEQVEAAMRQLDNRLRPKRGNPRELEADEEFERSLNAKQKRGLDKIKRGYAERVRAGDVEPRRGPGDRVTLDVKEAASGRIAGPPERTRALDVAFHEDELALSVPPHYIGNLTWSISTHWWGIKLRVNHSFLNALCVAASWFVDNVPIARWLKIALRLIGCLAHSRDGANDGGTCYVTWIGIGWCVG
jgi:hypothetical protein